MFSHWQFYAGNSYLCFNQRLTNKDTVDNQMWAIIIHVRNVKEIHRVLIFLQRGSAVSSIRISPLFNPSPSPPSQVFGSVGSEPPLAQPLWLLVHTVVGYIDLAGDDCL